MKELLQKKLSDSAAARWTALLAVSFTMMCGYFFTDVMSPLEPMLTSNDINGLGWTSDEYGFFSGAYGYFNVFLLLLFLLQPVEWYHYIVGLFDPSHTLPDWGVGAMYKEVAEYTKDGNYH